MSARTLNGIAIALGAIATIWILASYLPLPFPLPSGSAGLLDLIGLILVVFAARKYRWSSASTIALVVCLLPIAITMIDVARATLSMG